MRPPKELFELLKALEEASANGKVKVEVGSAKIPKEILEGMPQFLKDIVKAEENKEYIGDVNPFHFKQMKDLKLDVEEIELEAKRWKNENLRDIEFKLMQLKREKDTLMKEFDRIFDPKLNEMEERRKAIWEEISKSLNVDPDCSLSLDNKTGKIYKTN